jgi:hypothetical protein
MTTAQQLQQRHTSRWLLQRNRCHSRLSLQQYAAGSCHCSNMPLSADCSNVPLSAATAATHCSRLSLQPEATSQLLLQVACCCARKAQLKLDFASDVRAFRKSLRRSASPLNSPAVWAWPSCPTSSAPQCQTGPARSKKQHRGPARTRCLQTTPTMTAQHSTAQRTFSTLHHSMARPNTAGTTTELTCRPAASLAGRCASHSF